MSVEEDEYQTMEYDVADLINMIDSRVSHVKNEPFMKEKREQFYLGVLGHLKDLIIFLNTSQVGKNIRNFPEFFPVEDSITGMLKPKLEQLFRDIRLIGHKSLDVGVLDDFDHLFSDDWKSEMESADLKPSCSNCGKEMTSCNTRSKRRIRKS